MAAAEYFAQHPPSSQPAGSPFLAPRQPQRASSNPGYQYPPQQPSPGSQQNSSFAAPPPYNNNTLKPNNVHFAPTPPMPMPQRNSFSHGQRPSFSSSPQQPSPLHQQVQQYPNLPQNIPPFAPQNPAPWSPQPQYPGPHHRPYGGPNQSQTSLNSGYSSDPEYHRRRHHHHHKHGHGKDKDGRPRKTSDASRSTTTDGFIGAAGGGLIGDLIFPGLGTAAGALAGYFGGRDYGKHRKWREDKLDRDQERWVRKYGSRNLSPGDHTRDRSTSRSRSRDGRRRSHE